MKRYKLLGINIDQIEQEELYSYILKLSEDEKPHHIVLLDTYLLVKALFNKQLHDYINSASLVLPISRGISFGVSFLKLGVKKIYNYYNFVIGLLLYFCDYERFIYILGGKKKNIEKLDKNIKDSFPGIRLVGRYHGQYKKSFEKDLLLAIKKTCPSLILVGLPPIKQEFWIAINRHKFNKGVFVGVGEFVNIVSERGNSESFKNRAREYKISRKYKNPLRFLYYVIYVLLLILSKITKR